MKINLSTELSDVSIHSISDRIKNDIFHFEVRSKSGQFQGTGSDVSEELAFIKAQSELVERIIFHEAKKANANIKSSSGFAAHFTTEEASRAAYFELLERDLFLTSWLSGRSPDWSLTMLSFEDLESYQKTKSLFEKNELDVQLGYIGECDDVHCFISVLTDKNQRFGGIVATAADSNITQAVEKLAIDQRRVASYLLKTLEDDNCNNINISKPVTAIDHLKMFLNPTFKKTFLSYLSKSDTPIRLPPPKVAFEDYSKDGLKIKVVRCSSDDVQNYYIGGNPQNINSHRVNIVGEVSIERIIHPLG